MIEPSAERRPARLTHTHTHTHTHTRIWAQRSSLPPVGHFLTLQLLLRLCSSPPSSDCRAAIRTETCQPEMRHVSLSIDQSGLAVWEPVLSGQLCLLYRVFFCFNIRGLSPPNSVVRRAEPQHGLWGFGCFKTYWVCWYVWESSQRYDTFP